MTRYDELERFIDQRLKQLPFPEAPPTLLPGVLKCLRDRRAQHRSAWPWALRTVSLVAATALVVAGAWFAPSLPVPALFEGRAADALTGVGRGVAALAGIAGPLWRVLLEPVWGYVLVVSLMMGTSCAALGAALRRLTLGV